MTQPYYFEVGLLLRGQFRRQLVKAGIKFTETKSFLDSIFVIESAEDYDLIRRWALREGILNNV